MKNILFIILIAGFLVYAQNLLFYNTLSYKTSKLLKEDIELALHDAGLFLDELTLAEGYVVFDAALAEQAFRNSIYSQNTSFYKHPLEIMDFQIFDDSNTTFPYTYDNPQLKETKIFLQPTIYAVVKTKGVFSFQGRYMEVSRDGAYTHHYR